MIKKLDWFIYIWVLLGYLLYVIVKHSRTVQVSFCIDDNAQLIYGYIE